LKRPRTFNQEKGGGCQRTLLQTLRDGVDKNGGMGRNYGSRRGYGKTSAKQRKVTEKGKKCYGAMQMKGKGGIVGTQKDSRPST